jgi:hypothetical protein
LQILFTKTQKFGDEKRPHIVTHIAKNHSNDVAEELVNVTGIHGGKEKKDLVILSSGYRGTA